MLGGNGLRRSIRQASQPPVLSGPDGFDQQGVRGGPRINAGLLPPCRLIAAAVDLAVMPPAERHRELIADLTAQRAWLGKTQMMRIGGHTTANQAGLLDDEPDVRPIADAAGFGVAQFALVDAGGGARLSRFAGADLAAFPAPPGPSNSVSFCRKIASMCSASAATNVPFAPSTR